jgi:hypothetical protein
MKVSVLSDNKIQLKFRTKDLEAEYFHYTGDLFFIYNSGHLMRYLQASVNTDSALWRTTSPDANLLTLRRGDGFDVCCFCHIVRNLRPTLAEQEERDVNLADPANRLWGHCDMDETTGD